MENKELCDKAKRMRLKALHKYTIKTVLVGVASFDFWHNWEIERRASYLISKWNEWSSGLKDIAAFKKLKKFNSKSKYPEQKTEFSAISLFFRHGNSETIMAETLLYWWFRRWL